MSVPPYPDLDELIQRLLDNQIEPDQMQRLGKAIREDPRVRDYYLDSLLVSAVIRRSSQVTGELSQADLIHAISSGVSRSRPVRLQRRLSYAIAAVLTCAVLLGATLYWFRQAVGPAIGVLADAYEAKWRGFRPQPGDPLYRGVYDLREGAAKIALDRGTGLVLEAPCQIDLRSTDEAILRGGKLVVMVPPQAKGFRVRTRTAVITDLGTEFGVIVRSDGSTEAHVLKGHVTVALDPNKSGQKISIVVNEGQAAAVDARGRTIREGLTARTDLFLHPLPPVDQPSVPTSRLNLADLVGGGSGRGSGTLNRGIDAATGQTFKGPATSIRLSRRNEFRPSPQLRGVDGVFVPNGALGPVVISSTGLIFMECPRTMGSYFGGPANSGEFFDLPTRQPHTVRFQGVRYGTSAHPALTLHPNVGITFDLDEIRRDNPDLSITRFTAVCGIPKDLPQVPFSPATVWVLLDGVVRLRLHYPVDRSVMEKVDVPIPVQTRFLTLVATCSGRADYSWVFFGDPFLE
ncbi:MAG TPA: FecR domain-containing protein [Sedimentisphaerales bacterium]|nr:FecR domain-containing protein [Phycisphaerae bacterium]HQI28872.1 FecR domain-containing protein [Sedimentisphaerales bacterium]